ncbi:DUF2852 domain-containing protein [Pseudooceanicola sp. CBS1P-1]|uniref:DUF2852 domain-containing protein n=1 Tax=Pseudooceanicola albus TaxID=2692189 RepID=A0A6L7G0P0_9RHOB|nr:MULTISPECIES: DUF2852 domain-containing protein [Pseudooceanicola]MBT9382396.1 DUF2852 domain-containing protein [Pseudooceanicola endophyticus]MXN16937.1 DUF2852 domain-containing protein [Pseudooceanicola albus]
MTTATAYDPSERPLRERSWIGKTEDWMDSRGKWAWMTAMVLGFVFFWPAGLALLFYMIWGKKMFGSKCRSRMEGRGPAAYRTAHAAMKSSGNSAFDSYKQETLRRLEEEQGAFEAFLERLRAAKDKAEFDQFMDDRARKAAAERDAPAREEA